MTIIDYLLLAGFFAASIYTIYRLFLGWRHSPSKEVQTIGADEARSGADPISAVQSRAKHWRAVAATKVD